MADLLPQVIPVEELKSTTQPVQTNDAEIKMAIKDVDYQSRDSRRVGQRRRGDKNRTQRDTT